jgi:hypothetical protein
MITQQRSPRIKNASRPTVLLKKSSPASNSAGRLIQIALAFYLLPVLLIVLMLGGLGMVVVGGARLLTGPARGPLG